MPDDGSFDLFDPVSGKRYHVGGFAKGTTQDQAQKAFEEKMAAYKQVHPDPRPDESSLGSGISSGPDPGRHFGMGALQGAVLDPIEALGTFKENFTGTPMLGAGMIGKGFRAVTGRTPEEFKKEAYSTPMGEAGGTLGEGASYLGMGGLGEAQNIRSAAEAMRMLRLSGLPTNRLSGMAKYAREFQNRAIRARAKAATTAAAHPIRAAAQRGALWGMTRPVPEDQNYPAGVAANVAGGAAGAAMLPTGARLLREGAQGGPFHRFPAHGWGLYHMFTNPSHIAPTLMGLAIMEALSRGTQTAAGQRAMDALVASMGSRGASALGGAVGADIGRNIERTHEGVDEQ